MRRGEVVDGIFILVDGSARFVEAEESINDEESSTDELPEEVRSKRTGRNSWSQRRSSKDTGSEGLFNAGCCFGIEVSSITDANVDLPLEFWHYNILAKHNCRLFYLEGSLMKVSTSLILR